MEIADVFTDGETYILISIYLRGKNGNGLNVSKLAEMVGTSVNNPKYQRVLKLLLENSVIEHTHTIGSAKLLKINFSKLRDFVDSTSMLRTTNEYNIAAHHGVILHS